MAMDTKERLGKLLIANDEQLAAIDHILEHGVTEGHQDHGNPNCRLLRVTEACRILNLTYPTFHRAMQAGCFDVVTATGKTLITETSVREFANGVRKPSKTALEARVARANKMREDYHWKAL